MPTRIEADVDVQRLGYVGDEAGKRLVFPHAHAQKLEGRSGGTAYGALDCGFEGLEGRLDTLRWKADAASIGSAWLRDDAGRFELDAMRAEFPHGVLLVRAERGVELVSPHVTLSEVRVTIRGPFGRKADEPAPPPSPGLRQERLRFLDSLSGRIYVNVKVRLDLPVIGGRTLDQQLRVPIQEGSLDYHELENGLDWLEGQFLDIKYDDELLKLQWRVPIFGSGHDLITFVLDHDALNLAPFGRVPVRSLADFRFATSNGGSDEKKRKVLQSFALTDIDVALSLLAPNHVDIGGGTIAFGGEDQPGLVDLEVNGAIRDRGEGALRGAIGSIDTTIKDLRLGSSLLTADRLHFDGLDQLEVAFDGFTPTAITMVVHRVTATNLALTLGGAPSPRV